MALRAKFREVLLRFPKVQSGQVVLCIGQAEEEERAQFSLSWPDFARNRRRQCIADSTHLGLFKHEEKFPEYDFMTGGTGELPRQVVCQAASPSNLRLARLLRVEAAKVDDKDTIVTTNSEPDQLVVEVYDKREGRRISSTPVQAVHGAFVGSEGISWHAGEDVFAYVAERTPQRNEFELVEDWGEGYEGVAQPRIVLFDVRTSKAQFAHPLHGNDNDDNNDNTCSETSEFQPRFLDAKNAVVMAYRAITPAVPHLKLGLLYCAQRPSEVRLSWLHARTLQVQSQALASKGCSTADCPTFFASSSVAGGKHELLFLSSPPFETHGGPLRVSACEVDVRGGSKPVRHLTDVTLFSSGPLARQCVFGDKLYMGVFDKARERILSVDLRNGRLAYVDDDDDDDSSSRHLLAVSPKSGKLLVVESSPSNRGTVLFGGDVLVQAETTTTTEFRVVDHAATGCNSILYLPSKSSSSSRAPAPLVVVPHGGPHSCFTTAHMAEYQFLVEELGCAMLLVNYRGSLGMPGGHAMVDALLGRVGELDVSDVMHAMHDVLDRYPLDASRLAVSGGSHGGFIAAHFAGQFPDAFRCAVMRNPVIDMSTMLSTTDIPDWCQVEAMGGAFVPERDMLHDGGSALASMRAKSPIHRIANVTLPTLMCCGAKDRRVPYQSQGLFFHRMLKMHAVPHSRMLVFPLDGHPIDRVASSEVMWTETAEFLRQHLLPVKSSLSSKFKGVHLVLKA